MRTIATKGVPTHIADNYSADAYYSANITIAVRFILQRKMNLIVVIGGYVLYRIQLHFL